MSNNWKHMLKRILSGRFQHMFGIIIAVRLNFASNGKLTYGHDVGVIDFKFKATKSENRRFFYLNCVRKCNCYKCNC